MTKRKKIILWAIGSLAGFLLVFSIVNFVISNSVISSMADVRVEKNEATLAEYNLEGEQIEVASGDGIKINAYIVPHPQSQGNVIILHGMHGMDATSLFGYAKFIFDAGYTPVAVDMRAHGKSEGSSLSFGYNEVHDILAVVDYLKEDQRYADQPVILYGLSMGGSAAINTAAKSEAIAGIIAVSPFSSIQDQSADYMLRDGMPKFFVQVFQPYINLAIWRKFDVSPIKDNPLNSIRRISDIPVLIIHGDSDSQTLVYHGQSLYDNCSSPSKELWIVEGADHLIVEDVLSSEAGEYRARVIEFLSLFGN